MSEGGGAEMQSMSQSWITLAAMIIVGALALFSLYMGFQGYGGQNQEASYYYIIIGVSGFAAIGYMFFRSKAVAQERLDVPKVDVITTLECPKCDLKRVREFKRGDYIFKEDEPCTRCEGNMVITRIHQREEAEKKRRL